MIDAVKAIAEQLLGRGSAAISVPPMDGPLKPNHIIDNAEVVGELEQATDLASDGEELWIAEGRSLNLLNPNGDKSVVAQFDRAITALAWLPGKGVVVALGDTVKVVGDERWSVEPRSPGGRRLNCITAIAACRDGTLLVTESSAKHAPDAYARDLLEHGRTGRLCRLSPDAQDDREIVGGLRYPLGVVEMNGDLWFSESWAHRVAKLDRSRAATRTSTIVDRLPAYPSRMSTAAGGGVWLTFFSARRRLVEFVLREDRYRRAMMDEVDPQFWIAPMLSSGKSFEEPLQGGNVKTLGISKPWAPPRSYGLVVRLGADGLPRYSLHSRSDGHHHGIVSAVEANGQLYMLSKGADLLLRLDLAGLADRALT